MDEFVQRFSIYDLLARVITGGLALLLAYFSGLLDTYMNVKEMPILIFLLCAYGAGLVLEELSFRLKKEKTPDQDEIEKYKVELIKDNREDISDEPLGHVVLADSLKIACIIISLWKIVDAAFMQDGITTNVVINVIVLGALGIIFHLRKKHYVDRRKERMKAYYDAKYMNATEESK